MRADALVLFGATGDLARKKLFPALDVNFERVFGARQQPYQRLLGDALDGNPARFARQDGVEHAWRVIEPLLDQPGPVRGYPRGSWGPAEAGAVTAGHGGWHDPA